MQWRRSLCGLVCWMSGAIALAQPLETLPLYTYYDDAPFAVDTPDSLSTKLAAWLSARSQGRYHFVATQLPRKRLDLAIAKPGWQGVVAWASPVWFDDMSHTRFLWSASYMRDVNLIVSSRAAPVEYHGTDSLVGMTVGAVVGRRLADMEQKIAQGKIRRDDALSVEQSLRKLHARRVDVVPLQASSLPYLRQQLPGLDEWLYVASTPRSIVQRHFMTSLNNQPLLTFLNEQIPLLQQDPDWQRALLVPNPQK